LRTADHFVQIWDEGGALIQMLIDVMGLAFLPSVSVTASVSTTIISV